MKIKRGALVLSVVVTVLMVPEAAWPQASRGVGPDPSQAGASASADVYADVERLERRSSELARRQEELLAIMEEHLYGMEELRRRLESRTGQIEEALRRKTGELAEGYRSETLSLEQLRAVPVSVVLAGRVGAARGIGRRLRARDLEVSYAARSPVPVRSRTTIYYRPGHRQAALTLARLVPGWQDIFQHTGSSPQAELFIVPGRTR